MKKDLFTLKVCLLTSALALWSIATTAQSRSSGCKSPAGAAYMFNDGSTVTKTGEMLSTSTSDYNVVQVTNGTLMLNDCTIQKTGDYSSNYSGDDTSFYGTNSAVYASGSSAAVTVNEGAVWSHSGWQEGCQEIELKQL